MSITSHFCYIYIRWTFMDDQFRPVSSIETREKYYTLECMWEVQLFISIEGLTVAAKTQSLIIWQKILKINVDID